MKQPPMTRVTSGLAKHETVGKDAADVERNGELEMTPVAFATRTVETSCSTTPPRRRKRRKSTMKDDRKAVSVKLNQNAIDAIDAWMSETSCSRQVALVGLIVQGAKTLGVWENDPHVRATSFARLQLTNRCSTYDEGTTSTRRVSATNNETNNETKKEETNKTDDFSDFWYSIPKQFKRGAREEAKRKWNSKKVMNELRKGGLTPTDVADRYVAYFKSAKGEGYEGIRYVKHVSNWLDSFGFHDEILSKADLPDDEVYDLDLTQT